MKSVQELNQDQLDYLKFDYFYNMQTEYESPYEIPNEVIFETHDHTSFVDEDFYVITDLQEQDITEVVQPLVNAERDGYEEYDNQSLFQALMKRYPNNYLYFYEEGTIETLSY